MPRFACLILFLCLAGCGHLEDVGYFVSFAEGIEGRVAAMVRRDPVLEALVSAFDPHLEAFHDGEEACSYPAAPYLAGLYRDGKLCRNPAITLSDAALASVLRHEFLHFVWYRLTQAQRDGWNRHMDANPSPWEHYVLTHCDTELDSELFAYTLEGPIRPVDGAALVRLAILPTRFAAGDTTLAGRSPAGHFWPTY